MFCLQIVNQPIIKGERPFGRVSKFGELVSRQGTHVFVIERFRWWTIAIIYVMEHRSREGWEERDIRDAVRVKERKTGHSCSKHGANLCKLYALRPSICRSQMSLDQPSCPGS